MRKFPPLERSSAVRASPVKSMVWQRLCYQKKATMSLLFHKEYCPSRRLLFNKTVEDKHNSAPRQMADHGWRRILLLFIGRSSPQKYFLESTNLSKNGRMMHVDSYGSIPELEKSVDRKMSFHVQKPWMRWGSGGLAFHLGRWPSNDRVTLQIVTLITP